MLTLISYSRINYGRWDTVRELRCFFMKMNNEVLAKWKEDSKKATQGEWVLDSDKDPDGIRVFKQDGEVDFICDSPSYYDDTENNIKHIANACPQNFIALIERVEIQEALLAEYRKDIDLIEIKKKLDRYEKALIAISLFADIKINSERPTQEIPTQEARIAKAALEQE